MRPTIGLMAMATAVGLAAVAMADVAPEIPEETFMDKPRHVVAAGSALALSVALFGLVMIKRKGASVWSIVAVVCLVGVVTGALAQMAANNREDHHERVRQILNDWRSGNARRDRARRQAEGEPEGPPQQDGAPPAIDPPGIDTPPTAPPPIEPPAIEPPAIEPPAIEPPSL